MNRREFMKWQATQVAMAAAGASAAQAANIATDRKETEIQWSKAPCRFCGTGCSVMVASGMTGWSPRTATRIRRSTRRVELREGVTSCRKS